VPASEAGERQDGFVAAVDGVAGLAAAGGVLALDKVSGSDEAELANPGFADPVLALAGPALDSELADTVLPGGSTGSGAEAPSGLAGASGWPLPLDRDSSGGGIAALGMVASERLPPCGMVTADEEPSGGAEPTGDEEPDPDEEPGPDGESDSGAESGVEPLPFFTWTEVVAVEGAWEERGAVLPVTEPASSALAFTPGSAVS
jgi:hypothetical protein